MPTRRRSCTTSTSRALMSSPSRVTEPVRRTLSIRSFMRLKQRRSVDFPQPDGPMNAVTCRFGMARVTFFSAC